MIMHRLLIGMASYSCFGLVVVTSHCLAVVPQLGAKEKKMCAVYCIPLNSDCEAQRAYKDMKKCRR
jgi:hypothetical protein